VTGGKVHDNKATKTVLETPHTPLAVTTDKAYGSGKVRQIIKTTARS